MTTKLRKALAWILLIIVLSPFILIGLVVLLCDWFGDIGVVDWKNIRQERDF